MLNLKGISFLLAFGLCATLMAASANDFTFPVNQLEKSEVEEIKQKEIKQKELGFIATYKPVLTHAAATAVGAAIGFVIGYQIYAGNLVVATPTKGTPKNVRGRSKSRRRT